jgi:hypothetical protein
MDGSMQIYHAGSEQPDAVLEEPAFAAWPLAAIWEERHLLKAPLGHFNSNPSSDKVSQKPTILTWNSCLNAILNNATLDPAMKIVVRNRMKSSKTANGNSKDEHFFFSATEAGLVPNFSYPVTRSPFFDRLAAEKSSISVLANGLTRDNDFEQSQRTSTTTNRLLDLDLDLRLPNNPHPCHCTQLISRVPHLVILSAEHPHLPTLTQPPSTSTPSSPMFSPSLNSISIVRTCMSIQHRSLSTPV